MNRDNSTTALAPLDARTDKAAFEPATLTEALHVSQVLVASRLLPRSITTPEAAFAVIATGRELGLSAMQSLRAIHIVEGKPTLSADLMVALVKRSPECGFFRLVESTGERATYETQRRGEPGPTRLSFTIEEARAAGAANKDNWRKFPAAMLRARAASGLARAVFPDLVLGVYDPDELDGARFESQPAPVAAPVVVTVNEPAPARRTRKAVEVVTPDVVDVQPEPKPEPVALELEHVERSETTVLESAIRSADTLEAACAVFDSTRGSIHVGLPHLFAALLERCDSLPATNVAAGVLTGWKTAGVTLSHDVASQMRALYAARRAELAKGVA